MRPTRLLDALNAPEPFDVCIVGSRGGTILGPSLAAQGVPTPILESGTGLMRWFFIQSWVVPNHLRTRMSTAFRTDGAVPLSSRSRQWLITLRIT